MAKVASIFDYGRWVCLVGRKMRGETMEIFQATPSYFLSLGSDDDLIRWLPDPRDMCTPKSTIKSLQFIGVKSLGTTWYGEEGKLADIHLFFGWNVKRA
ncbi:hypothetical protein ACH5RR_013170 [Cinchona calisaya]|uniref:Uncharacterized protein n=1 Tax=Cinchona calisaya TaxID=153742 RepID=A0ABD3A0L7_9GENT